MSDSIALALIQHLVRDGQFDGDDINAIADALERKGEGSAAHSVRVQLVEAFQPTRQEQAEADFRADWARRQIRERTAMIARENDGGNDG